MNLDSGSSASYAYDGLHRRIKRTEGSSTRHFYYNEQWQCVEERATESGGYVRQYAWHPHYVDALAFWHDADGFGNDGIRYCLHDALFSVTTLLNPNRVVVRRYAYDAYGKAAILNANFSYSGSDGYYNEHLYTGRRTDPGTGLQLNRYRYYHQQLGRWVSRDPIGYAAGDVNLYGYVLQQPTFWVDAFGLHGTLQPDGTLGGPSDTPGWTPPGGWAPDEAFAPTMPTAPPGFVPTALPPPRTLPHRIPMNYPPSTGAPIRPVPPPAAPVGPNPIQTILQGIGGIVIVLTTPSTAHAPGPSFYPDPAPGGGLGGGGGNDQDDDDEKKDCTKARPYHLMLIPIPGSDYKDEHDFKTQFGACPNSRFDICACNDGTIVIRAAGLCGTSGPTIPTGERWNP